jgi:hypothetical protein
MYQSFAHPRTAGVRARLLDEPPWRQLKSVRGLPSYPLSDLHVPRTPHTGCKAPPGLAHRRVLATALPHLAGTAEFRPLPPELSERRLQGRLTPLHTTRVGPNPAFIVRHPTLPHRLYATTECIVDNGELLTLELDRERGLVEVVARQSAVRSYPSYLPRTLASRAPSDVSRSALWRRRAPRLRLFCVVTVTVHPCGVCVGSPAARPHRRAARRREGLCLCGGRASAGHTAQRQCRS